MKYICFFTIILILFSSCNKSDELFLFDINNCEKEYIQIDSLTYKINDGYEIIEHIITFDYNDIYVNLPDINELLSINVSFQTFSITNEHIYYVLCSFFPMALSPYKFEIYLYNLVDKTNIKLYETKLFEVDDIGDLFYNDVDEFGNIVDLASYGNYIFWVEERFSFDNNDDNYYVLLCMNINDKKTHTIKTNKLLPISIGSSNGYLSFYDVTINENIKTYQLFLYDIEKKDLIQINDNNIDIATPYVRPYLTNTYLYFLTKIDNEVYLNKYDLKSNQTYSKTKLVGLNTIITNFIVYDEIFIYKNTINYMDPLYIVNLNNNTSKIILNNSDSIINDFKYIDNILFLTDMQKKSVYSINLVDYQFSVILENINNIWLNYESNILSICHIVNNNNSSTLYVYILYRQGQ